MHDYDDHEPEHASSPTAHLLEELSLYGYRPFSDEADPRPLPEERIASGAIADMFDALIAITRAEGLAALIATHNFELASRMDRALLLHQGKLIEGTQLPR